MELHHFEHDHIRIEGHGVIYEAPLAEFLVDAAALGLSYTGKGDADELLYQTGKGRLAYKNGNMRFEGPECLECEGCIAYVDQLAALKEEREKRVEAEAFNIDVEAVARGFLAATHWVVLREDEVGTPIPPAIADARQRAYKILTEASIPLIPKELL